MIRIFAAATVIAGAITAAAAFAAAGNHETDVRSASAVIEGRAGHVDCRTQVWPSIDSRCLGSVSENLTVRTARIVEM